MSRPQVKAFYFDLEKKSLQVLDQLLLPVKIGYINVANTVQGYNVIKNMNVRGAPCIAAVGCLSLIAEMNQPSFMASETLDKESFLDWFRLKSDYLISSRPTAVNLRNALAKLTEKLVDLLDEVEDVKVVLVRLTQFCCQAIETGKALNIQLGDFGAEELLKGKNPDSSLRVLTHCNTGALATVGYGTALGVIRSLRDRKRLDHAFCTETRPYNQGSRLTAWELVQEAIPATLVADSMVAHLMSSHKIDAVVVGADCVTAKGDVANKIGTYQIAVLAEAFNVPFYVAAPTQSIDLKISDGTQIEIEQRPQNELKCIGSVILAPDEVNAWNPCFDVTPSRLVRGIITEYGVCQPDQLESFVNSHIASNKLMALF